MLYSCVASPGSLNPERPYCSVAMATDHVYSYYRYISQWRHARSFEGEFTLWRHLFPAIHPVFQRNQRRYHVKTYVHQVGYNKLIDLKISWGLFHNRWYIFTSLEILAFLFATSCDLADGYRSFGGTDVEENGCRGTCSMIRHCVLFPAVTFRVCDDAWRLRFVMSDHNPNEPEGDGVKCVYTWRQTVEK
jgi:hypothetical protein